MKVSLIISTYNWKEALNVCLKSVQYQSVIPYEVVVADDGSTADVREFIDKMREDFPCTLKHVWHEDKGFRLAKIRNKAIIACEGDYIIQIDGDIIMHSKFIEDHMSVAKPGCFVVGSRVKLSPELSQEILSTTNIKKLSPFVKGLKSRQNSFCIPFFSPFFFTYKSKDYRGGKGCHMAFWKRDIQAINGYNEAYIGYGAEDYDIIYRMLKNGVKKHFLKFKGIQYHIYHKQAEKVGNEALLKELFQKTQVI